MYEFDGFGKRIEMFRKAKGFTQEELAVRLGITSQAISKWENDASYPDIAQLPALCTILGTTLDDLFGKVKEDAEEENAAAKFPQTYNGLKLVFAFKDIACYSDKQVKATDETNVTFEDGSMAELANKRIINKGTGEIKLLTFKKKLFSNKMQDVSETKRANFEFGKIKDFDFNIRHCRFFAEKSDTEQTTVEVEGDPEFVEAIKTEYIGSRLSVKFDSGLFDIKNLGIKFIKWQANKIVVKLAYDETNDLNAAIHGNGEAFVGVDFRSSHISIHGSGKMDLPTFGNTVMSIHGSGNIDVKSSKNVKMSIHGAGNMKVGEAASISSIIHGSGNVCVDKINEDISVSIHGSGNVGIHNGKIKSCEFSIFGGGVIDAEGITTDKTKIKMHGGGHVTIGRVKHESVENIHGGGKINILNRGE